VREYLRATPGHKFAAIDSTYNAFRFEGQAKINEAAVQRFMAWMQRLCDDADCTIVFLWHPSQAGQDRGSMDGWSVAWHNAPRARLSISADPEHEDRFELKVEKRNHGPKGKPVTLHYEHGALILRSGVEGSADAAQLRDACVAVAIQAAEHDAPIQKQRRLHKWMLDEIEGAVSYRPKERDVKEELASAMRDNRLRYLNGTTKRSAGYYPSDPEQAAEMARAAKQRQKG
jgi:RecA-family ATPase